MKMNIIKQRTTLDNIDMVKDAAKQFKAIYTDGDLYRIAHDEIDGVINDAEILKSTVDVSPANEVFRGAGDRDVVFYVELVLSYRLRRFQIVGYFITAHYINDTLEVIGCYQPERCFSVETFERTYSNLSNL